MKLFRRFVTWLERPWACDNCGFSWYFNRVGPHHPCGRCGHTNS